MKEAKTMEERFDDITSHYDIAASVRPLIKELITREKLLSRNEGIEEAMGAVPEKVENYFNEIRQTGWNECRSQTLAALEALKIKE